MATDRNACADGEDIEGMISSLQRMTSSSSTTTSTSTSHDNSKKILGLLQKIRTALSDVKPSQQRETSIGKVSIQPLFSCLKRAPCHRMNREIFELIGVILMQMLDSLEISVVMNQFRDEILWGMDHPEETIRTVCLKQVRRCSKCQSAVQMLHSDADMISLIISRIGDDCLSVAQVASSTLLDVMCASDERILQDVLSEPYLVHINRVITKGDIFKYRIFELVTKVATHSCNSLAAVAESGLLQHLLLDLTSEDELIQMNAIEMLSNLATCKHGLKYMDQYGILTTMEDMLIAKEVDPLILPTLLKFYCYIAKFEPMQIRGWPNSFFKLTLDLVCSDDTALQACAVDTIATIGSTLVGKEALHRQGPLIKEALGQFGKIIQQPPMEMRVCGLFGLASLFSLKNAEQTNTMMIILEEWFVQVTSDLLQTVIGFCKQPFAELKCAAFSLLQAIANQEWAQRRMNGVAGFHEYLLDRSHEQDQTCRIAKFNVIKTLQDSATSQEIFGRPFLLRLNEYVRDGPLYIPMQSEVALRT